ncbi:uncharacterized protein LOC142981288 [Anticarsia gemmatalis]|uniref:uncharacterized protein LOC142981288 n=1 Tax=Anticarsia gemmatalis TaxID=129554 RepID=UPI003F75F3C1
MMSSEDLYLNRAKFVMTYLGVWVPAKDESIFRKIYRGFMMTLQYLFLIFQIIYIFQVWGDLDAVSQASYLLFTQACLCLKVTVFQINMDMLRELLRLMDEDIMKPKNGTHEKILKLQANRIKRLLLAFMISSQITCGMWALKPLFDDAEKKFPFDMWMPVNPEKVVQYYIGYAFQLVTICISAYMYFGVDSVAFSAVIFGCAQIDIIKEKIMGITPVVGKRGREAVEALSENYKTLVDCLKHHQAVITFTELVENAYHSYLLFQLTGSVGIICMSALRILVLDWRSVQFFSILTYLSVMISQLFVCCWCGHELTAISEDLHTVFYKCIWYEQDVKFKRDLCFAMMRMSRPLVLRAGRYILLSRQTFVAILRMSYSYFAVLNQTTMGVKNTSLYLGRPDKILSFFGVWPQPNNYVILRKLWMLFVMWTQYSFLVFEIIYIVDVWGDIDAVSEASYLLFTQASLCYKSTAFMVNKGNLIQLLEYMDSDVFEPKSEVHEKILEGQATKIKRLCLFFLTSATTTCTLWACIPLFDAASKRSFPFRIWMPVEPTKSPHYELGYLYQIISIYISAFLFIGVDSVAVTMIMFGCAQLEIIMDKIKKVEYVNESGKSKQEQKDIIKTNNDLLVECVKQHQTVEKFIQLVEDTYHANIFFQLSGTVAIICNIGLRISIVDHKSVQFFSMINYMVTMLSQLFLYCWCGHELTIRSEDLRDWLYQCPWYEQGIKFGRALWIAMERMKKPIIFKAGHYISLSRPTFVSILRCSYSYFAVLNRVNNE